MSRLLSLCSLLLLAADLAAVTLQELPRDSAAQLTGHGNNHLMAKQYDTAKDYYQRALAKDQNYFYALFNLALTHQTLQQYDEAEDYYERARRVRPDSAETINNLGIIAMERNNLSSALKYFRAAADKAVHPETKASYLYNLGTVHERMRQYPEAEQAYKQSIQHHRQRFEAHYNLGSLYLKQFNNLSAAEAQLSTAHQLKPDRVEPLLNLAVLKSRLGQYTEADAYLDRAVKAASAGSMSQAKALWIRANYADRLQPPRKMAMVRDLNRIIEIDPHFPGAHGKLGLYYESVAEYDLAITHMEQEVQGEHDDPDSDIDLQCHYALSRIYHLHRRDSVKSLEHATKYYQRRPDQPEAQRLRHEASQMNAQEQP